MQSAKHMEPVAYHFVWSILVLDIPIYWLTDYHCYKHPAGDHTLKSLLSELSLKVVGCVLVVE